MIKLKSLLFEDSHYPADAPEHFGGGENIDIFGYQTKHFDICRSAVTLYEKLRENEEAKDLMTVAATDRARALTQEGVLAEENTQPDYLAELITKLESLSSLPDNITKNSNGTYTYHCDPGNGAAAMEAKPLTETTLVEQMELLGQIMGEDAKLSEGDLTSETAIEGQGSFVSRVTAENKTAVCCNVM